jgi:hypothetical protein
MNQRRRCCQCDCGSEEPALNRKSKIENSSLAPFNPAFAEEKTFSRSNQCQRRAVRFRNFSDIELTLA